MDIFTTKVAQRDFLCAKIANNDQIYISCNFLLAGDDVELRTEAEAGVHQMACAVWGRMQRRRQPWL